MIALQRHLSDPEFKGPVHIISKRNECSRVTIIDKIQLVAEVNQDANFFNPMFLLLIAQSPLSLICVSLCSSAGCHSLHPCFQGPYTLSKR